MRKLCIGALVVTACLGYALPAFADTATPWRQSGKVHERPSDPAKLRTYLPAGTTAEMTGSGAVRITEITPEFPNAMGLVALQGAQYVFEGTVWYEGLVQSWYSSPRSYRDIVAWRLWEQPAGVVSYTPFGTQCWILPSPQSALYAFPLPPRDPGVAEPLYLLTTGVETTEPRVDLSIEVLDCGPGNPSGRWWDVLVTNGNDFTVDGVIVNAWERSSSDAFATPGTFLDGLWADAAYPDELAPGESCMIEVWGDNVVSNPADSIRGYFSAEGLRKVAPTPVYRFYNWRKGTHFYTASETEKANVIAKLGGTFRFEGPAFGTFAAPGMRTTPLYRFYNLRTGAHFFTADENEKNQVIAKLSKVFRFEGIAFYVADYDTAATQTIYRFYNMKTGTHFYTADEVEKMNVINRLSRTYRYEGTAYRVPK